jgi:spore coat polysaccharide biosynthesis predicted glycosyltransferase SpsG
LAAAIAEPVILYADPDYNASAQRSGWITETIFEDSPNDAANAIAALGQGQIDALVIDAYAIEDSVVRSARAAGFVAVFRDGAPYGPENVTINPNPGAAPTPNGCFGPAFMPLASAFAKRHAAASQDNRLNADPIRILIAFGAQDSANLTSSAVDAIAGLPRHPLATIALPSTAPHAATVAARVAELPWITVLDSRPDLAELYGQLDLAIGAPGVSQFERACCGLSSVLVPQNERQEPLADGWASTGAAIRSPASSAGITKAVTELLQTPHRLTDMRKHALSLVDGQGASRLATALKHKAAGQP